MALTGLVALTLPAAVWGHSDPWGEIHPQLAVQGGKFIMTFYRQEPGDMESQRTDFRVIYNPNGSVAVPRHVIDPARTPSHHYFSRSNDPSREVALTRPDDSSKKRMMVLKDTRKQPATEIPLAVNCEGLDYVQNATFTQSGVGIVVNARHPSRSYRCLLTFLHVDPQTYLETGRVVLGPCPKVYDFPAASEPVWAGNRWWIAWMGISEVSKNLSINGEGVYLSVTLSSYDPVSGKVQHKWISDDLDGDCRPSLKTVGGWLGVAWHSSQQVAGKRGARVLTAFEKIPDI